MSQRRLSSITIFFLVAMIPFIYILEKLYTPFLIQYIINKISSETPDELIQSLEFLFTVFPWGAYFGLVGALGGIAWARRAGENITNNLNRGPQGGEV